MESDVGVEQVGPRELAAVWADAGPRGPYGPLIIKLLDQVWPVLRSQQAKTGHNVVLYYNGPSVRLAAGVEVLDGFQPTETVQPVSTPSGEAVRATHWGDYGELGRAYAALERWFADTKRRRAGINWEVYGDWNEDPAQVRTDVYMLLEPEG